MKVVSSHQLSRTSQVGLYILFAVMAMHKSTSLTSPVRSDPKSGGQVYSKGCEGFSKVIDQHPEEDTKYLQFTGLKIWGLYWNKL